MAIEFQQPATADEYRDLVQKYSFLVDAQLKLVEENEDNHYLIGFLPALISAVNVIGYLRGQDNMFIDARPWLDFQTELYRNEDAFEHRLSALISRIMNSANSEEYKNRIQEYYMNVRTIE